jgi:hypothetical protein
MIKLYKLCYNQEQIDNIQTPFHVWNNLSNSTPGFREYPIIKTAYNSEETKNLEYWGILSPKFEQKTNITGNTFLQFIENNNANVYFINPTPINEAIYPNVLYHGEAYHPGIMGLISRTISRMGFDLYPQTLIMDHSTFAFCNYFCGDRKFWDSYINFIDTFLSEVANHSEDNKLMFEKSAQYSLDKTIPYYAFVIERLFSVFLVLHPEIKSASYKYSKEELLVKTDLPDNIISEVIALSDIKKVATTLELKRAYSLFRNRVTNEHKFLFHRE